VSVVGIGFILAASFGAAVVGGLLVARRPAGAVTLRGAGLATCALGGATLVLVASGSAALVATGVIVRAGVLGALFAISWALGALGARDASLGGASVNGVLTLAMGVAYIVAPLAGSALAQTSSERLPYALLVLGCAGSGGWLLAKSRSSATAERLTGGRGSVRVPAAVDERDRPGHVGGVVGREEADHGGDLLRAREAPDR
jgi:hypothetical protein